MSKRIKVILGVVAALLSVWIGAIVITFLPEGTIALHVAAFCTSLIGLIGGIVFVFMTLDRT